MSSMLRSSHKKYFFTYQKLYEHYNDIVPDADRRDWNIVIKNIFK